MPRSGWLRGGIASIAAALMLVAAVQLARVDADLGQPYGPDRLINALDQVNATETLPTGTAQQARMALANRPIDGRAYRVLAQVAISAGEESPATQLLEIAVRRWPRDRIARALLMERAFAAADTDTAALHIDALLRVAPDLRAVMFVEMGRLLKFPEFRESLVQHVLSDPPWRAGLVRSLVAKDAPAAPALAFIDGLGAQRPLTEDEQQVRVALLGKAGRPRVARAAWLAGLDPVDRGDAAEVFDGGFEAPHISGGYGWQIRHGVGFAIGPDRSNAHTGNHSLAVAFDGRAVQFAHVQQLLALPAGNYRLSAVADNKTTSSRAFGWQLSCVGSNDHLAQLPLPSSPAWQVVDVTFAVPAGCESQQLLLRHAGRNLAERQMRGILYVDDVQIADLGG